MARIEDQSDEELARYAAAIKAEQDRRRVKATAQKQAAELNRQYLDAAGIQPGQEWVQPTGAHDAYPADWKVVHGGQTWTSLLDGNVWEPGVSGWRPEPQDEGGVPEFVQPTGAHDAYQAGDLVMFEGSVYESTIDGNTWSPTEYPQGWKKVDDDA